MPFSVDKGRSIYQRPGKRIAAYPYPCMQVAAGVRSGQLFGCSEDRYAFLEGGRPPGDVAIFSSLRASSLEYGGAPWIHASSFFVGAVIWAGRG